MKYKLQTREKISSTQITDKELISLIYMKLLEIKKKKRPAAIPPENRMLTRDIKRNIKMTLKHYTWPSFIKDKQITTDQPHPVHTDCYVTFSVFSHYTLFRVALSSIILRETNGTFMKLCLSSSSISHTFC